MLEHVRSALSDITSVYPAYNKQAGYELSGFVWFQGWNNMVDSSVYPSRGQAGGYNEYSINLAHFIRDIRQDLNSPQ